MIARVAMADDAVAELGGSLPAPLAKAQYETFRRAIEEHAVLVFSSDKDVLSFLHAVKRSSDLPPGVSVRWIKTVEELYKRKRVLVLAPPGGGPRSLTSLGALEELRREWGGRTEVVVLPSINARDLGVDDGEGLLLDEECHIEIALPPMAPYSRAITQFRELAQVGRLAYRAPRSQFWSQVLRPVAKLSTNVVVLDRYLFSGVWRRHENVPRSRHWEAEQVCWLLEHLDGTLKEGAHVQLIGGCHPRSLYSASETADLIRSHWSPRNEGRLGKVEVTLAPWEQDRGLLPHDRHIRFDVGVAIQVAAGFDRLGRHECGDPDGMAWHYLWHRAAIQDLRKAEDRAARARAAQSAQVL